jgi:hypothetical protein
MGGTHSAPLLTLLSAPTIAADTAAEFWATTLYIPPRATRMLARCATGMPNWPLPQTGWRRTSTANASAPVIA